MIILTRFRFSLGRFWISIWRSMFFIIMILIKNFFTLLWVWSLFIRGLRMIIIIGSFFRCLWVRMFRMLFLFIFMLFIRLFIFIPLFVRIVMVISFTIMIINCFPFCFLFIVFSLMLIRFSFFPWQNLNMNFRIPFSNLPLIQFSFLLNFFNMFIHWSFQTFSIILTISFNMFLLFCCYFSF